MDLVVLERLGKFKLSGREEREFEIDDTDTRPSREVCGRSLVGRIVGENVANFTGLKKTMAKLWCAEGELRIIELRSKTFQFVFSKEEERQRVLDK